MRIDNLAVAIQGGGNHSVTHNIKGVGGTMDPASVIAACSGTGSTNMLRVTFTRT